MLPATYPSWIFDGSPIPDPFGQGERAVRFLKALKHPMSRLPGRAFQLDPWQERIVRRIYGPRHEVDDPENGIRRGQRVVNTVMLLLPRGNRKTSLAAALGLLHTFGPERVPRGQNLTAAADRKQARLAYDEAASIIGLMDKATRSRIRIQDYRNKLILPETGSFYEAISCDAGTQHGRTPSFAFVDELHVWRKRLLWEAISTGVDKVDSPLTIIATTAGRGKENLAHEIVEKARRIARGEINDPTFLPVLFEAPPDADWRDEAVWRATNPGLAHGYPSLQGFRRHAERAEHSPAELDSFKQLKLNIWLDHFASAAFDMARFDAGTREIDRASLRGQAAWIGVDLSRRGDQTAVVVVIPQEDGHLILPNIFIPAEGLHERSDQDDAPYPAWLEAGLLTACPGATIDFNMVEERICQLCEEFDVQEILFDQTFAGEMMTSLMKKGHNAISFPQVWANLSPAAEDLIKSVKDKAIFHDGNPALRWTFENTVAAQINRAGNVMLRKGKRTARIDPVVATAMALSRAKAPPPAPSIYDDPDFNPHDLVM